MFDGTIKHKNLNTRNKNVIFDVQKETKQITNIHNVFSLLYPCINCEKQALRKNVFVICNSVNNGRLEKLTRLM